VSVDLAISIKERIYSFKTGHFVAIFRAVECTRPKIVLSKVSLDLPTAGTLGLNSRRQNATIGINKTIHH
jgi:hypothetical protein